MDSELRNAINDAIREDRVPILRAKLDSSRWVRIVNGLGAIAQDWAEMMNDHRIPDDVVSAREYWGSDEDGDRWQIRVYAS